MKDNQLLLNFMYERGFTDDEMHDPEVVEGTRQSMAYVAHLMGSVFRDFGKRIAAIFSQAWDRMKPIALMQQELEQQQKAMVTSMVLPKPIFKAAPLMRSQVLDRKPTHQIRKIIR